MALQDRQSRKQQRLGELTQLLGLYDRFGPEQQTRQAMGQAQLDALRQQNAEGLTTAPLRQRGLEASVGQQEASLGSFNDLAPLHREQLLASIREQGLANQLRELTMGDAVSQAQAGARTAQAQSRVAEGTALPTIQAAGLANAGAQSQLDTEFTRRQQMQEQTQGMRQARQQGAEMFPVQQQGAGADILHSLLNSQLLQNSLQQQATEQRDTKGNVVRPAGPPPIGVVPFMQQYGMQLPGLGGEAVPQGAESPYAAQAAGLARAYAMGLISPGAISSNNNMSRILSGMQDNPAGPWPPEFTSMLEAIGRQDMYGAGRALQGIGVPGATVPQTPPQAPGFWANPVDVMRQRMLYQLYNAQPR